MVVVVGLVVLVAVVLAVVVIIVLGCRLDDNLLQVIAAFLLLVRVVLL